MFLKKQLSLVPLLVLVLTAFELVSTIGDGIDCVESNVVIIQGNLTDEQSSTEQLTTQEQTTFMLEKRFGGNLQGEPVESESKVAQREPIQTELKLQNAKDCGPNAELIMLRNCICVPGFEMIQTYEDDENGLETQRCISICAEGMLWNSTSKQCVDKAQSSSEPIESASFMFWPAAYQGANILRNHYNLEYCDMVSCGEHARCVMLAQCVCQTNYMATENEYGELECTAIVEKSVHEDYEFVAAANMDSKAAAAQNVDSSSTTNPDIFNAGTVGNVGNVGILYGIDDANTLEPNVNADLDDAEKATPSSTTNPKILLGQLVTISSQERTNPEKSTDSPPLSIDKRILSENSDQMKQQEHTKLYIITMLGVGCMFLAACFLVSFIYKNINK